MPAEARVDFWGYITPRPVGEANRSLSTTRGVTRLAGRCFGRLAPGIPGQGQSGRYTAWLRAHARGVALVLTVTGYVDAANCVCLREHLQRFVKLGSPLILDAIEARLVGYHGADLFDDFASHCARARVECALVGGRHAGPSCRLAA